MPLQQFAMAAVALVRWGGVPAAIGLASGFFVLFITGSEWAGVLFGLAAGGVSAGIMASRRNP